MAGVAAVVALIAVAVAVVVVAADRGGGGNTNTNVAAADGASGGDSETTTRSSLDPATTVVPPTTAAPTATSTPKAAPATTGTPALAPTTTSTARPFVPDPPTCDPAPNAPVRGVDVVAVGMADGLHERSLDGSIDQVVVGTRGIDFRSRQAVWESGASRFAYVQRTPDPWPNRLVVVDVGAGCWRAVTPDDGAMYGTPSWSTDGLVGYQRAPVGTPTYDPATVTLEATSVADPTRRTTLAKGSFGPEWAPDGSGRVAFADREGLKLLDPSTGRISVLHATTQGAETIEWSPDARTILFSISTESYVWVVPADGSGPARNLSPPNTWLSLSPSWSPDGSQIAFKAAMRQPLPPDGRYVVDAWVMNADGSGARKLTSSGNVSNKVRWSADGTRLFFERRWFPKENAAPTFDVAVVDVDGGEPALIADDARLSGTFRRAG